MPDNVRMPRNRVNAAADSVAAWPPLDVPNPNPFFPPAPRAGSLAVSVVFFLSLLVYFGLAAVVVWALLFVPDPDMNWFFLPLLFGLPTLGLAIYTFPMHRNALLWRNGRILPARVLDVRVGFIENVGFDPEHMKLVAAIAGIIGGPLLVALIGMLIVLSSTRLEFEWADGGRRRNARIFMGFDGCGLDVGQTIWVLARNGKPRPAMFAASWSQQVHRVPPEVEAWLSHALSAAEPTDAEALADFKRAAKAND